MVSFASVAVAVTPWLTVGVPADLTVFRPVVLLMVVVAFDAGDVVTVLSGCVPAAVALLVTPFAMPAPLFTSARLNV